MSSQPIPPSCSSTDALGQILRGRYRLESLIGLGASSTVYRALDLKTGCSRAIKRMRTSAVSDGLPGRRFRDEGAILSQLCHPNIVAAYELDVDDAGLPFLVMEYLQGEDLLSLLQRRVRLSLAEALDITQQVGCALSAAHAMEIAHRDIKPSNLFILSNGRRGGCCPPSAERPLVKVVDFGVAKDHGLVSSQQTANGIILGTPEYMAPECTRGNQRDFDPRADQWSLAVVLYRMLAGCLPFHDPDLATLIRKIRQDAPVPLRLHAPSVPEHVGAAIHRALSKEPADRFPAVQDFVRSLHGIRRLLPPTATQPLPSDANAAAVSAIVSSPPALRATQSSAPAAASIAGATIPVVTRRRSQSLALAAVVLAAVWSAAVPAQTLRPPPTAATPPVRPPQLQCTSSAAAPSTDAQATGRATAIPATQPPPRPSPRPPAPFPPLRLAGASATS